MNPFLKIRALGGLTFLAAISTAQLHAILDTNANNLSDLWEKQHNNGNLFPNTFLATNDEDQDGWTNAKEAIAGTNPFQANPPDGIVAVEITPSLVPGAFTLTWPTLIGKNYQLKVSTDLVTWTNLGDPITTTQNTHTIGINTTQPNNSIPENVFWQVAVTDLDSDGDGLTDTEENTLGTNPNNSDSDGDTRNDRAEILAGTSPLDEDTDEDGLNDNLDATPLQNDAIADPDGANLAVHLNNYTTATNGVRLIARYDFEALPTGANNDLPSSVPAIPAAMATNVGIDRFSNPSGMPSFTCQWNNAPTANEYLSLPHQILDDRTKHTWSYWLKLPKNAFVPSAQNTGIRSLLSIGINQYAPSYPGTSSPLPALHWYCDIATGMIRAETYQVQIGTPAMLGSGWNIPAAWNDGEWHHIVLHKSDNNYKIYFDGVDLGNRPSNNINLPLSTNSYTLIGRRDLTATTATNTAFRFPPGSRLDRLRCYTSLTAADVLALYNQDIDHDDLFDRNESRVRYWNDRNANGVRNADESDYVQRPFHHDNVGTDHDRDGIASHTEQNSIIKTNPSLPDSDGDLMLDGWELANGLNPLVNDAAADKDMDGVSNIDEYRYGSNANNPDSDGDGTPDAAEISQGSHPNDARDGGQPIPVAEKLPILLGVGDQSSSHSEDYVINCFRINPDTGAEMPYYVLRSGGQGQYAEQTVNIFRKEDTYTFQIKWISSSLQQNYNDGEPDFDYTLKINPTASSSGKLLDSYDLKRKTPSPASSVRAVNANDKFNFIEEIEKKRVALVNLKVKWEAYPTYNNIENHIDPWTNQVEGKRIFPDFLDPSANELRDKARIQISNGLPNIEVKVKSFDVDDSTSEDFDKHFWDNYSILDHTPYGNDNFSASNSILPKQGYLWNNNKWNAAPIIVLCDDKGKKAVDFKVSMHPGDNYRVCAELLPVQVIDQVTVDSVVSAHSLGFVVDDQPNIPTSDSLTVWRCKSPRQVDIFKLEFSVATVMVG
jgi:hypothetical protein